MSDESAKSMTEECMHEYSFKPDKPPERLVCKKCGKPNDDFSNDDLIGFVRQINEYEESVKAEKEAKKVK